MAKRRSVSIRATLGLLIVVLGSLLVGESAVGVSTSWRRVAAATRLATLSEVDEKLFAVLTAARMARSTMLAVLAGTTPIDPAGAARIAANRTELDANFQQAKEHLSKPGLTISTASLTNLQAAYDAVLALRPQLSAAVRLPGYARDQNLVGTAQQILRSFVEAITATSDAVEQAMLLEDPAFGALLRIKQAAFDMRVALGSGYILMNIAAGAERSWTGEEIAAFADSQTSRDLAWARLAEAKTRPETPPQLVAAIGQIDRYYDYVNGPQKIWVDTLIAGHPLDVARQDLERRNAAQAQPILDAAITAMRAMVDHAERARRRSLRDLALNTLCAAIALAVAIAGLLIAERRISRPLLKLTRVMRALADRDTSIDISGLQRRDEIGAMARTVVLFRDEIIRAGELTALAATQEAEKAALAAEATAQIEAMANAQGEVVETVVFGLMQLTEGNLAFTLSIPLAPEYEMLRELFNQAVTGLRGTVRDVLTHSAAIGSGAGELAGAADELAKRTQIQATSIEQAAAALDQITATIGQTASASLQAQSRAAGATEEAQSSSQVVGETVAAMAAIDGSARRIGQIIGLIDEIALQTNLLALNAAIEAANAGPAGVGFALVAAEVRLLAQRAAVAAKEIKAMVVASTRHVSRGVQLVDETGAAIGRIIAGVSEINAAITLIAAAAREQASGIAEVNTTFNQMDQVTQANAAMVEQSTAAVHALAAETAELNQAMGRFTLAAA